MQYFDGNKRIWYAFNTTTRQFVVSDSGATAALSMGMAQPASQTQWQELVDPTTNNTYYYNSVTKESSWTPPPGFAAPSKNMPQQSIVSSTVVQKPQTFGLQVTKSIHSTSATQSSGAVHRSFPIIVAAGSSWNDPRVGQDPSQLIGALRL